MNTLSVAVCVCVLFGEGGGGLGCRQLTGSNILNKKLMTEVCPGV